MCVTTRTECLQLKNGVTLDTQKRQICLFRHASTGQAEWSSVRCTLRFLKLAGQKVFSTEGPGCLQLRPVAIANH